jgi:hypothetical protein
MVIDNIQVELVVFVEPIVSIMEPIAIAIESLQFVQPIVEPIQMENPQFFRSQPIPISNHSTKTLR